MRLPADSAGIRIYDLEQCYGAVGTSPEPCDAGRRYRVVPVPALPKDSAGAKPILDAVDSLIAQAVREGRHAILVPWDLPATAAESKWVAAEWANLTSADAVSLVLARRGVGTAGPVWKSVQTPALGSLGRPSSATRGLTVATLRGGVPAFESLLETQSFHRSPDIRPTAPQRPSWFMGIAAALGEPGRTAILWIAVLTAFLTVATLWKVPGNDAGVVPVVSVVPVVQPPAPAPQPVVNADTPKSDDSGDVFRSNLGRTVLSGLTGIAAVTILKDIWGISGPVGQSVFASVFIVTFFLILFVSAILRAFIEGARDRIVQPPGVDITGAGWASCRRFLIWMASFRTTIVVVTETAAGVLFGHPPDRVRLWADRYDELQIALLDAIKLVRNHLSRDIGVALKGANVDSATEDSDYRVSISLLDTKASQVFYIAPAPGSLRRILRGKDGGVCRAADRRAEMVETDIHGRLPASREQYPVPWTRRIRSSAERPIGIRGMDRRERNTEIADGGRRHA